MLSDLTSFYWFLLVDQNFIISPLSSMVLSFILGSLYWTNVLWSTIINLGRSIRPMLFIYINYLLVCSIDPYSYILLTFLVSSIKPILLYWSTLVYQSIQILGLLYRTSFLILVFFFLVYSTIHIIFLDLLLFLVSYTGPILLFQMFIIWATLVAVFYY